MSGNRIEIDNAAGPQLQESDARLPCRNDNLALVYQMSKRAVGRDTIGE